MIYVQLCEKSHDLREHEDECSNSGELHAYTEIRKIVFLLEKYSHDILFLQADKSEILITSEILKLNSR